MDVIHDNQNYHHHYPPPLISTLGAMLPGVQFFSDSLNHASLIEGIRHSRAPKQVLCARAHICSHHDIFVFL
jgi:7-keto-8-aminopelargonate synthetase-like enzyme